MSRRGLWATVAIVVLGLAIWGLRAFTQATYRDMPPDSRTVVTFDVVRSGAASTPDADARALLWPCIADVSSELVGDIAPIGQERFRAMLQPALDTTRTRKFGGCLRDLRVPHVRATAVVIERAR